MSTNWNKVFFEIVAGKTQTVPFCPDITTWYLSHRIEPGQPQPYWPGQYIPDDAEIHKYKGTMPPCFASFTLLDFYRYFDWAFHAHIYDWLEIQYGNDIEIEIITDASVKTTCIHTPKGTLTQRMLLAADGSWAPHEYYVKSIEDLDILSYLIDTQKFVPDFDRITETINSIGSQGQADITINRSPFGKLVHNYAGFEKAIYLLMNHYDRVIEFLRIQEHRDLQVIRLAAQSPCPLVIITDHADETLISPRQYLDYCIPFYQKANRILHDAGKIVSTYLDGNFKGYFGILDKTEFDVLDGCTPWPMFNYTVEELAQFMPKNMIAFCGVPSTLFCQNIGDDEIIAFGKKIFNLMQGRVVINVGDILPPDGNINQVIALGQSLAGE